MSPERPLGRKFESHLDDKYKVMETLPIEIATMIFAQLPRVYATCASLVCKYWENVLVKSDILFGMDAAKAIIFLVQEGDVSLLAAIWRMSHERMVVILDEICMQYKDGFEISGHINKDTAYHTAVFAAIIKYDNERLFGLFRVGVDSWDTDTVAYILANGSVNIYREHLYFENFTQIRDVKWLNMCTNRANVDEILRLMTTPAWHD